MGAMRAGLTDLQAFLIATITTVFRSRSHFAMLSTLR